MYRNMELKMFCQLHTKDHIPRVIKVNDGVGVREIYERLRQQYSVQICISFVRKQNILYILYNGIILVFIAHQERSCPNYIFIQNVPHQYLLFDIKSKYLWQVLYFCDQIFACPSEYVLQFEISEPFICIAENCLYSECHFTMLNV